MSDRSVQIFADEAREFTAWADGRTKETIDAPAAIRRLASLYLSALSLPDHWSETVSDSPAREDPSEASLQEVMRRTSELPVSTYWELFDPLADTAEEPVCGALSDDLHDVYRDIARGLAHYEAGRPADALWEWGFNFQIHWGKHAVSAIRVLHEYLCQEEPSGLHGSV